MLNKISLDSCFTDERGTIQNILNKTFNHTAIITSKKGCVRSNHYHKQNSHYIYLISGEIEYWERDINNDNKEMIVCKAGDMIFSPPNKVHKTIFLSDTTIITFAANYRGPEFDQFDTVKIDL